jgi:glutamate racemase
MWVPLIENNEYLAEGADYFVKKDIARLLSHSQHIDTVLLACTHYPLLINKINQFIPNGINVISQGKIVADSLSQYLSRHPAIEGKCSQNKHISFFTTDSTEDFDNHAANFYGMPVKSTHLAL